MTEFCWECEEQPIAFKCLRCREDVCVTCVELHVCADERQEEDAEPDE